MNNPTYEKTPINAKNLGRPSSVIEFQLPPELEATAPPELRPQGSGRRDDVRLLVLDRRTGATTHSNFGSLDRFLRAGDLLVVNTSRTLPSRSR